eukprot:SAG31_NODE_1011_length_10382_cov_8.910240_2_plen_160_part_00
MTAPPPRTARLWKTDQRSMSKMSKRGAMDPNPQLDANSERGTGPWLGIVVLTVRWSSSDCDRSFHSACYRRRPNCGARRGAAARQRRQVRLTHTGFAHTALRGGCAPPLTACLPPARTAARPRRSLWTRVGSTCWRRSSQRTRPTTTCALPPSACCGCG